MLTALTKVDKNPLIAKMQAAVGKALTSWKKGGAIGGAHELAWYMRAAGNQKAARSIVDEIADNVVFANNYNVWGPAAEAICAAAHFAHEAKDKKRYKALIARVVEVPAYAATSERDYIEEVVGRNVEQLDAIAGEKRAATQCLFAANSLTTLVYFVETLRVAGFPYDSYLKRADIERELARGQKLLAKHLVVK